MPRKTFGEDKICQRDRCLEIAAKLKRDTKDPVTPSLVTTACLKAKLFTAEQLDQFQFETARRRVEQWMKTPDDKGLPLWGQLPLVTADGERAWEFRLEMKLSGYAWNYLVRDDVVEKNKALRERWKDEALERWPLERFNAEVERLREERETGAA